MVATQPLIRSDVPTRPPSKEGEENLAHQLARARNSLFTTSKEWINVVWGFLSLIWCSFHQNLSSLSKRGSKLSDKLLYDFLYVTSTLWTVDHLTWWSVCFHTAELQHQGSLASEQRPLLSSGPEFASLGRTREWMSIQTLIEPHYPWKWTRLHLKQTKWFQCEHALMLGC